MRAFAVALILLSSPLRAEPPASVAVWLKQSQAWERDTDGPIVSLGQPGAFDDTHIFAPLVSHEGGRFQLWYCGSTGRVAERVFSLGLATSPDGRQFKRHSAEPVYAFGDGKHSVLTPTLLRNPDGSTLREAGRLRMWFSSTWFAGGSGQHTLHEATSEDGISWSRPSLPLLENVYAPSIIREGTTYRMWFIDVKQDPWVIRHASSTNGRNWDVHEAPVLTVDQNWERTRLFYPTVLKQDGVYLMWYGSYWAGRSSTTALGFAASADGLNWYKHPDNPVLRPDPDRPWESHYVTSQSVIRLADGSLRIWYASRRKPPFVNKYFALNTAVWKKEPAAAVDETRHQRLFHSGRDGYPRFRIPSLVTTSKGTLLAICEGRADGGGLQGNVDLVQRRSPDSGRTWSPLKVIADEGSDTLGNPCAVVDRETGFVWLAFTRSPGEFSEEQITRGESSTSTRVFVTHSRDDGLTWSRSQDITQTTKRSGWTWYGTGPGTGIQLQDGRLVIPSYHTEGRHGTVTRSHCVFSDDHGQTWQPGESAGIGNGECQILERSDGTLYLSARTSGNGPHQRSIVISSDRGRTWAKKSFDPSLYDPHCEASLLSIPNRDSRTARWLYCHPAGPRRRNLTIRISRDEGRTWPDSILVRRGDSQYSSMTRLPDGSVGVLYDTWRDDNYQLYFVSVPINE